MNPVNGTSNNYPEGQCTRYADEQYHLATGYYVPWQDNASGWATKARAYGWSVSDTPVVPSILCLQPGVQGAHPVFGHVAEVVSIGKNNTFTASNLNWGDRPTVPINVTFHTGPGVSFIFAPDKNGRPIGDTSKTLGQMLSDMLSNTTGGPIQLAPDADVTALLYTLDSLMLLTNPFNVPEAQPDSFSGPGFSFSFTDPVAYVEGFGLNLVEDIGALTIRMIFVVLSLFVFWKVLSNFIDFGAVFDTAGTIAKVAAL